MQSSGCGVHHVRPPQWRIRHLNDLFTQRIQVTEVCSHSLLKPCRLVNLPTQNGLCIDTDSKDDVCLGIKWKSRELMELQLPPDLLYYSGLQKEACLAFSLLAELAPLLFSYCLWSTFGSAPRKFRIRQIKLTFNACGCVCVYKCAAEKVIFLPWVFLSPF